LLSEFERRLADVLGARLPVPFRGGVDVAPGRNDAQVVLSVRHVEPLDEHLFGMRSEVVPGAPTHRRVVRLRCDVGLDVRLLANQSRSTQLRALDSVIYELDEPGFRSGARLQPTDGSDPGFLVQRMFVSLSDPPQTITLRTEGLFWPPDVPGQTGVPIERAQLRISMQPVNLIPARPRLNAGGETLELTIEFGAAGTMRVERGGRVTSLPFGAIVVAVEDAGGRPGAGTLSGGNAGPAGSRTLPVTRGRAAFQYTPPAQPALDNLIVSLDDGEGGIGIELGRFPLEVRSV
jgi:hypothetical protein